MTGLRILSWVRPFLPAVAAALVAALPLFALVWDLGSDAGFRAGFAEGRAAAIAAQDAHSTATASRQLEDRLNAQDHLDRAHTDDRLCGPSARDCTE